MCRKFIIEYVIYRAKAAERCTHGILKKNCKKCGGSGLPAFCMHQKQKRHCVLCGGSGLCIHNVRKGTCKECKGASVCDHNKRKANCVVCGGSNICVHGKIKQNCAPCGGSAICAHGKLIHSCKECGDRVVCDHGRFHKQCRDCGGSAYCIHSKLKARCDRCTQNVIRDPRTGNGNNNRRNIVPRKDTRIYTDRDPECIARKRSRECAKKVVTKADFKDTPAKKAYIAATVASGLVKYDAKQLDVMENDREVRELALENVMAADNFCGKKVNTAGKFVRGPQKYKHNGPDGTPVVKYAPTHVEKVNSRLSTSVPQSVIDLIRELTFEELQHHVFSAEKFSDVMDNSACQSLTQTMVDMLRTMIGTYICIYTVYLIQVLSYDSIIFNFCIYRSS